MDRAEATGLGVAVVGHAALVVALALGLAVTQRPLKEDPMEVSFVEEVGPVSTAPETSDAPAPAYGEELAPVDEASGATGSLPAPITAPVPEPIRPPLETGERRRPDLTRNPVVVRSAPPPRLTPQPRSRPEGQVRRSADRAGRPGSGPSEVTRGSRLPSANSFNSDSEGSARQQPAALTGAQRQAISRQIGNLIAPCARRIQPPNGFARSISVVLRVSVNPNGVPTGHQLVSKGGTNPENSDYVDDVVAGAMRAVRACASQIATLPAEYYQNGWRQFRYEFKF